MLRCLATASRPARIREARLCQLELERMADDQYVPLPLGRDPVASSRRLFVQGFPPMAIMVPVEARTRLVDWGQPMSGLPVRLASLIFTLAVPLLCLAGIASNWPADCPPAGCSDPEFAGSAAAAVFFAAVLLVYVAGSAAVATNRVRVGVALLVAAAILTARAII